MILPVAETFVAPQGEGIYTGTLMLFIRLAGCSVGKPWTEEGRAREAKRTESIFEIEQNHEMCCLQDGRTFCCDTDYTKKLNLPIADVLGLVDLSKVKHVCITGGEPLLHASKLASLFLQRAGHFFQFHLETSGTVSLSKEDVQIAISNLLVSGGHITVSPKLGYRDEEYSEIIQEAKLLVDEDFSMDKIPPMLRKKGEEEQVKVYLQPVNGISDISHDNMDKCLIIQQKFPWLRISSQSHKLWRTQ